MNLSIRRRIILFGTCAWAMFATAARSMPVPRPADPPDLDSRAATSKPASPASAVDATASVEYVTIPGPLRSFLRMAGTSQKARPEEVLPLLGHFVEMYGYEGSKEKSPKQTEALLILKRYVAQAHDLSLMAGAEGTLRFNTCEGSKPLVAALGYKLKNGCRPHATLDISDEQKAFITVDSGFPLVDVEEALDQGKPFSTPYASVQVPLIWTKSDWAEKKDGTDVEVIDNLISDPTLARLYWALSRLDDQTRNELHKSAGMEKMVPVASVLDFYGAGIAIRDGRVDVPGGTSAEAAWSKLVGAAPGNPAQFTIRLLEKDGGWLAEFYDSVARAPERQQAYFTNGDHLERFYEAFRGNDSSKDSTRSIFRPGAELLMLTTRLPLDEGGNPLVPGSIDVWRDAFRRKSISKAERDQARKAQRWTTGDQLVEGLFAVSRANATQGPLDIYLTISEADRRRPAGERLSPETVKMMIEHSAKLHDQYAMFSEFSGLNDASIALFIKSAERLDAIRDPLLRGDAIGIFDANTSLWQILARQGEIPPEQMNDSWRRIIEPFNNAGSSAQLFDAGRASLAELMTTATGKPVVTQEKIIALLAGPDLNTLDGRTVHAQMATRIAEVLTDQRLVSLDTILELRDDLGGKASNSASAARAAQLAEELEESRSPRAMFTETERSEWAPGHEQNKHVMAEMRTDLKKTLGTSLPADQAAELRGELTPFLRDTLVGLNYAYYEPPGAQILHNSPLLVRSHDFLSSESVGENRAWMMPQLFGIGEAAGHGSHLSGSLAGLPFALAQVEQDFIVPENVQALIWHDTAADLLTTGVVPRWWTTSQDALHAVALYQRAGEELVAAAAKDANARPAVVAILADRLPPQTMDGVNAALAAGRPDDALTEITPADTFRLAIEFRREFPGRTDVWGPAGVELESLALRHPEATDPARLSMDFGTPHPILAGSYTDEMLNLKPFPSLMGYASQLLAESWESTNLYWARLADEMNYTPVMLNELTPVLTRRMVEKIFGSNFDDWPALIRAMRETGDEFRRGQVAGIPKANANFQQQ